MACALSVATFGALLTAVDATAGIEEKPTTPHADAFRGVPAEVVAMMKAQLEPSRAAQLLKNALPAGGGFTNLLVDGDSVVLRWRGELPDQARSAVEQARKIAPVRVESARYSYAELEKAADDLADAVLTGPESGARSVTILGDGSGLRVGTTTNAKNVSAPDVGVPVEFAPTGKFEFHTRNNDSAPWWGGGALNNANGRGGCTAGFPVTDGGGGQWMLTAAHCGTPPDTFRDGAGENVGQATREVWQHDILLVAAGVRGPSQGYLFTGGRDDHGAVRIGGWAHAIPGEVYCQSGITTAGAIGSQLCGLVVQPDFTRRVCGIDSDGDYTCASDLVAAATPSGTSSRPGDSGGPVYGLSTDNRAFARGTVTGTPDGGRTMFFQDFATVYNDFGVWPVTP